MSDESTENPPDPRKEFEVKFAERAWEIRFAKMLTRPTPLTRALIIFLCMIHIILVAVTSKTVLGGVPNSVDTTIRLALVGAKSNAFIDAGEWWRFVSAMFLHGGLVHLLFNVWALHYLGRIVENALGLSGFLLIYFGGGLMGSYFSYLYTSNLSVGASGSIFALLGAAAAYGVFNRNRIPERMKRFLVFSPLVWIGLNVIISFSIPKIDLAAHAGGLVVGLALTPFLGDRILLRRASLPNVFRKGLVWLVMCGVVASFGFLGPRLFGIGVYVPSTVSEAEIWDTPIAVPSGWTLVTDSEKSNPCDRFASLDDRRQVQTYRDGLMVNYLCILPEPRMGEEADRILRGLHERNPQTSPLKRVGPLSGPAIFEYIFPEDTGEGAKYRVLVSLGANERLYLLWVYEKLFDYYLPLMESLHRWPEP